MNKLVYIGFVSFLVMLLAGCSLDEKPTAKSYYPISDFCEASAFAKGIIFRDKGKILLQGGEGDSSHFDITNWTLRACQLNPGLGRDAIPALYDPVYTNVSDYADEFHPDERIIILFSEDKPKIFPFDVLRNHVVINDMVDGEPVMISYSILADLAGVYTRKYCDATFTFAVSGYTYWDYNVMNAVSTFLLWDRETESLWWPLLGKAVSGLMRGVNLMEFTSSDWMETTWQDVLQNYPDALVLEKDQAWEPPENWPRYAEVNCK